MKLGTALQWCLTIGCVAALTMAMADGQDNVQLDNVDAGRTLGEAQEGDPYVVRYLPTGIHYYRVWSDGLVDWWVNFEGPCEWVFNGVVADAVDHPAAVIEADTDGGGLTIQYADGRVDHIFSGERCTIVGPGGATFCRGDTDRSGVTDVLDLLAVLADWGTCTGG